jgi:adenosylhomocysteine nucleosidase
LSFGLAGGLDPALRPGTIVIPRAVLGHGERFVADAGMIEALAGANAECVLGAAEPVSDAVAKRRLWENTGASAVDLESGAVARVSRQHGLPFAVLRAVCDPAERKLPPAALIALNQKGAIQLLKVLASVAADPGQIPSLLALAREAAAARRALIGRVAELRDRLAGV